MASTDTIQEPTGVRKLTNLQRAAGMRERVFTDEEVEAENLERNKRANAQLLAELQRTAEDQDHRANRIPLEQDDVPRGVSEPQTDNRGNQRESQNVVSNTTQPAVPSEPQADNKGKQRESQNVVSSASRASVPSEPQDKKAMRIERQTLPTQASRPAKESSTTISCPECEVDLHVILRALPSDRSVLYDSAGRPLSSSRRRPNTYKPSSPTQAGQSSLPAVKEAEPEGHTYPPKPEDFTGCQKCWEMVQSPSKRLDPPPDAATPTPTKYCSITCGCLDIFLGAAKKIFGACVNALKNCGCCGLCLKVVEKVPLVKERRKKREGRKGKRAERRGNSGENDDGQGIELKALGRKGRRKEKQSASVGGFWESDQQAEESGDGQGARGNGTGGQESRAVVMSGRLDGVAGAGERRETEYDRKRAEDGQKSPWQRVAGTVMLNRRR